MDQGAPSIEQLQAELALRRRQLDAVRTITAAVYSTTSLDELIRELLEACLSVAQSDAGSIILHDPETDKLVFAHVVGPKASELSGTAMPRDQGIAGRVFRSGQLEVSDNVQADPEHYRAVGERVHYLTSNMVTAPLKQADGRVIGVMQVLNRRTGPFTVEDVEVLTILANQAAMAIDHARLNRDARLAEVVKLIGDIAHDVKNLLTPVDSGAKTLEMLWGPAIADVEATLAAAAELSSVLPAPEVAAHVSRNVCRALEALREFVPEFVQMALDGSSNVTARAREIADCIKGEVSTPTFELASVNDVAVSVAKVLRLVAERHEVSIDLSGLGPVDNIPVDRKLLHSAIYNLVNNAIPETPAGGRISIATSAVEGVWPEGGYVEIVVEDTGRGIPPHVLEKLFTSGAISTKATGTGLGTRIVKNAVDAHGGTISVSSEVGSGTRFTIRIPSTGRAPLARAEQHS